MYYVYYELDRNFVQVSGSCGPQSARAQFIADAQTVTLVIIIWSSRRVSEEGAVGAGYAFRSKHCFNNKNEVSLMLAQHGPQQRPTT